MKYTVANKSELELLEKTLAEIKKKSPELGEIITNAGINQHRYKVFVADGHCILNGRGVTINIKEVVSMHYNLGVYTVNFDGYIIEFKNVIDIKLI